MGRSLMAAPLIPDEACTEMLASVPEEARCVITAAIPMGRMARPAEVASAAVFLLGDEAGSVTFRTKTGSRTIPVSPAAKALFERLAKGKLPAAWLFTNGGEPWMPQDWAPMVKAAAAKAELSPEIVAYTLRHCWITDAILGGMDLLTVAKLTGTSLEMISKTYGHLVHDAARDKAEGDRVPVVPGLRGWHAREGIRS